MKRLVMRADDLGYSEAVNLGIARSVQGGLLGGIGLMPNMPASQHGFDLVADSGIPIGQHTNVCVGRPVSDPALIPSMVQANGEFRTSREYRSTQEDFVVYEEAVREVRAQLERFREITGREPEYFEGHAVASDNFFRALEDVAAEEGLRYNPFSLDGTVRIGHTDVLMLPIMLSDDPAYDAFAWLQKVVGEAPDGCTCIHISHPGWLDDYLLRHSSNCVNRTREVEMLVDPATREWLESQNLELITYNEL